MKKKLFGISGLALLLTLQFTLSLAQTNIPAPPDGNLRYSITVSKFANEANWHGQWDLGDGLVTSMTNILYESGWFIVLGDTEMRQEAMYEQDFAASGRTAQGKKSAAVGRMTPAQLLVRGSITHVENNTASGRGGFNFKGISIGGGGGEAQVNVTIYLVDSETGQVRASTDIIGKSGRKGFNLGYHGSELGGLTGGVGGEKKDNLGKAVDDAVGQAVQFLIGQLGGIPWEGSVLMVKDDRIIINRGTREGVQGGLKFRVGSVEELVDPDTGEVLDSEMTQVGTIVVTEAKEKIAYCVAEPGSQSIAKGMTIFAMNR
ncbi:MAG: CsgG/HfaB family protein [Desulfobulbaceae bacterium]|nr:CsgG/HfaB family protein [Desulfobulbaceae bacterium]